MLLCHYAIMLNYARYARYARLRWAQEASWAGSFEPSPQDSWACIAGDASGGRHSGDAELRQVGVGIFHLAAPF